MAKSLPVDHLELNQGDRSASNLDSHTGVDDFSTETSTSIADPDSKARQYEDLQNSNYDEIAKSNDHETMNNADEIPLKNFLASSLHMDSGFSGQSSEHNQDGFSKNSDEDSRSASSSNEEDTQCEVCQRIFLDQYDLDLHIRSRRMDDKRYMCCNCQKPFRDNTQLKVHSRKHTGEKPFECMVCGKKFTVNGNLNKHMRIHTGERRFECSDCGKKFTQFAHLEDHLKTHSGDRPFVCGYCQASFKTKARLRKHEKSHTSVTSTKRSVKCPQCDIVLKSNRQLAAHLTTHVQDTDGPFICHLCGKSFSKYPNLQEHQRSHGEMKNFFCEFCDKKFANSSHLRRHMNSHSGFRPYSCSICKRGFPSSQNLKRHMMIHTGEKPYNCTDCGRKFLTLENLNRHRRTHTGEKPFACEICGRVFAHSTTAKEHYRSVHTGEKPFGCSMCQQSFAISKVLYKHVKVRHPEYFPQFKKEQELTPNMKKALSRFRTGIKCEDGKIKFEFAAEEASERSTNGTIMKTEPDPLMKGAAMIVPEESDSNVTKTSGSDVLCSQSVQRISQHEASGNPDGLIAIQIKKEVADVTENLFESDLIEIPLIKTEKEEAEEY